MERRFIAPSTFHGLDLAVQESRTFDRIVRGVYQTVAREVYGSDATPGLAAFAYGSPGRVEMVGGDSDADVFLAEASRTEKSQRFRRLFNERLLPFDFSKIDMPDWGTSEEVEDYLANSLVEGNQILETRFLAGDRQVDASISSKKKRHDTLERMIKCIVFNRLYFDQYFTQRTLNGAPNIKYCNGGSRDFLFVYWHDKLDRALADGEEDPSYRPKVETGLRRLFEQSKLTEAELINALEAVSFLIVLRSDVLRLNKHTRQKGLTYLDEDTAARLQSSLSYPSPKDTMEMFEKYRKIVQDVAKLTFEETIKKAEILKGQEWGWRFRQANDLNTPLEVRAKIPSEDPTIRIALIWGASNSGQEEIFQSLAREYRETDDWPTIGSIVCSPLCPPELLRHFGTGQAKQRGYGYLLRVIARHNRVDRETLANIAHDDSLGPRYTEVARAALNGGFEEANRQV